MLWIDRGGIAVPVAAMGWANDWDLLKQASFQSRWPKSIDLNGNYWQNRAMFVWSDLNGDGHVQPEEVVFLKASSGGVTIMPDLSFVVSLTIALCVMPRSGSPTRACRSMTWRRARRWWPVQVPTSSGGDQALVTPEGRTILTVAPKPFAPESVGGAFHGKAMWSYPSLWPGLHASHESPPPDRPGELIGTTRLLGGFVTPAGSDAGRLWAINGNMALYLFTDDGLFVATLFHDVRQGRTWTMPAGQRNMLLNDLTLHDENFWPSIAQTADGKVYLVDGDVRAWCESMGWKPSGGFRQARFASRPLSCRPETVAEQQELGRQESEGQRNSPWRCVSPTAGGRQVGRAARRGLDYRR